MNKLKELEIEVYGRVQGVNFRNTVKKFADKHGLKGYVMNKEAGYVFIVAQGKSDELDKFIEWLKSSPSFSKVNDVIFSYRVAKAKYSAFDVIRHNNFLLDHAKSFLNLGKSLIIENKKKVPVHVVIIPDGNRRWAREKGLDASFGHYTAGSRDHISELITEASHMGVKYLTFWGFSTENWKRDSKEINAIFKYIEKHIDNFMEQASKNDIRFRHIGRKDRLPRILVNALGKLEKATAKNESFNVQLCLDYGGRDEIIRAVNKLISSGVKKVSEKDFSLYLDTRDIPDPDFIIRTSGEKRLSGFMPFQAVYAELYFANVYFPEFDATELRRAVNSFGKRVRRFGATAKEDLK